MYACMHLLRERMHTYMHACMNAFMYAMFVRACNACMHVGVDVWVYACMNVCMCVMFVCMYAYLCARMHVCSVR